MKKVVKLLSMLLLITLAFIGCSNSDEANAKKTAEQFANNLYTVNAKQVTEYSTFSKNADLTKVNESIDELYKNIKPLMTDKGYENLINNREVTNLKACAKNDCTMQVMSVTLTKMSYDSKENKAGYNYEVKFKLISNKDKKEQIDVSKGYIGLSKENDQWKVYSYKLFSMPKALQ